MKSSEQQISAAQTSENLKENSIISILNQLGTERCELHTDEIITHLCCKQSCTKVRLCIKCLILDRDHYLAHNPAKNFKSIEELIEIADKAFSFRNVPELEKKLKNLLEAAPQLSSKIIAELLLKKISECLEPEKEEYIQKSLEQENYLWLQQAAKGLASEETEQIAQKLMKNTDSDNFLFTQIQVAEIEKIGYENWILSTIKEDKFVQENIKKISKYIKNLLKRRIAPNNHYKHLSCVSRFTQQCDPYDYGYHPQGVAFRTNREVTLTHVGHYMFNTNFVNPGYVVRFSIVTGRDFIQNNVVLNQDLDLYHTTQKVDPTDPNNDLLRSSIPDQHLKIVETPELVVLEANRDYSFWYTYIQPPNHQGIQLTHYWGNVGQEKMRGFVCDKNVTIDEEDQGVEFTFMKTTGGGTQTDRGDNGYNWGHFPMVFYTVLGKQ